MTSTLIHSLDAHGRWRGDLHEHLGALRRFLEENDLLDEAAGRSLDGLRNRISADKLVVAFVAEFSRGKSELINAIFFADTGRRVLPATPGRTTMCPVELGFEPSEAPGLALLPIETRLENLTLTELRQRPSAWKLVPLEPSDPQALVHAMRDVTLTRWVTQDEATALGFWNARQPQDNPATDAEGRVEVPAWRHAMINFPHPLLRQGLVVLDTPGLNAIGAEPELTLSLLPSAHAAVFILGADTGVTRSDLTVWQEHLGPQSLARFVALNKIDTLADPLLSEDEIEAQIARQCASVAGTLSLPAHAVFPLSARNALAARIAKNEAALAGSRLPVLEQALARELMPRRHRVLGNAIADITRDLQASLHHQLADRKRQVSEQLMELRGLRGKNDAKVSLLLKRVRQEASDFEQCVTRLQALRAVHLRMVKDALDAVSATHVRSGVETLHATIVGSMLNLGTRKAFSALCAQLRQCVSQAQSQMNEIQTMLSSYFARLNADFGFSLHAPPAPEIGRYLQDLDLIERNYEQYLGFTQSLRWTQPKFQEQFRRMLVSRLRVVFENAAIEIEQWNQSASALVDTQLRDRRKDFRRRQETLERVRGASAELEMRIEELQAQHEEALRLDTRLGELFAALSLQAQRPPEDLPATPVRMPASNAGLPWPPASDATASLAPSA